MRNFIIGVVVTVLLLFLGAYAVAWFGILDITAEAQPGKLETYLASKVMDTSVARHADRLANPVPATEDNVSEGMTIYSTNCAGCHGRLDKSPSKLEFSPPAPHLIFDPPDDPEWHTFYIIRRGIRWTGMPAWNMILDDQRIWQVTAFLARLDKLPSPVGTKTPNPTGAQQK